MEKLSELERSLVKGGNKKAGLMCKHEYELAGVELDVPLKRGNYTTFMPTYCAKCNSISGFPSGNFEIAEKEHAWSDPAWDKFVKKLRLAANGKSVTANASEGKLYHEGTD